MTQTSTHTAPGRFAGMVRLERGTFTMGSEGFYPEERPLRRVSVDAFWIDETPVTNRQFAEFVAATGYRTFAELPPNVADYPGMRPEMARAGSLVFRPAAGPVDLRDYARWWEFTFGADWAHPLGADSTIEGLEEHPVVHVTSRDAEAYASWAGRSLPSEAEWEYAARGGLDRAEYAWGDELAPGGRLLANYWQGRFPFENLALDGWERTSPVRTYPPNGYDLYDMIGNVWELTCDWYGFPQAPQKTDDHCCTLTNPRGCREEDSFDARSAGMGVGRKVMKGGSYLCAASYCARYRPAARQPQPIDTSTSHCGFRCIIRDTDRHLRGDQT